LETLGWRETKPSSWITTDCAQPVQTARDHSFIHARFAVRCRRDGP
jgi:hypothetical protein